MAVEVGTAYVRIMPSAQGFRRNLERELGGELATSGQTQGKRFGSGLIAGAATALKGAAVGVGVGVGVALSAGLVKGFGRLSAIEQAEAKLNGLGHSARAISRIMDNALKSVQGTAFGLDEAASVAASAVAAGIKPGKELFGTLRLIADSATIGGTSLSEMGLIWNKVASANKVQGDVINQLNERGIPIVQLLGKELGITAGEVVELASKGRINFDTFRAALESGVGGAAVSAGDTTQGAFKNMGAAASRFGANLLKGVYPLARKAMNGITGLLDDLGPKLGPLSERVGDTLGKAFSPNGALGQFGKWLRSSWLPAASNVFRSVAAAVKKAWQQDIGPALSDAVERIRGWGPELKRFGTFFATGLAAIYPVLIKVVGFLIGRGIPAVVTFAEFAGRAFRKFIEGIGAAAPAVGGFVQHVIQGFAGMLNVVLTVVGGMLNAVATAFGWVPIVGGKLKGARDAFNTFKDGTLQTLDLMAVKAGEGGELIGKSIRLGLEAGLNGGGREPLTKKQIAKLTNQERVALALGTPLSDERYAQITKKRAKKNGKDTGKSFLDGIADMFSASGAGGDAAKKAGKKGGKQLRDGFISELEGLRDQIASEMRSFSSSVSGGLVGFGEQPRNGPPEPKAGAPEFVRNLRQRIGQLKGFAKNIRTLAKRGLPEILLRQIIEAGLDGVPIAAALAASDDTDFNRIRKMGNRLDRVSGKFGAESARALYGTGVDSVNGLIAGLRSGEGALSKQMRRMARLMVRDLRDELGAKSPARAFIPTGQDIDGGVIVGIRKDAPKVEAAVRGMVGMPTLARPSLAGLTAASQAQAGPMIGKVEVHNPVPERASESTANVLRRTAWTGGWGA